MFDIRKRISHESIDSHSKDPVKQIHRYTETQKHKYTNTKYLTWSRPGTSRWLRQGWCRGSQSSRFESLVAGEEPAEGKSEEEKIEEKSERIFFCCIVVFNLRLKCQKYNLRLEILEVHLSGSRL